TRGKNFCIVNSQRFERGEHGYHLNKNEIDGGRVRPPLRFFPRLNLFLVALPVECEPAKFLFERLSVEVEALPIPPERYEFGVRYACRTRGIVPRQHFAVAEPTRFPAFKFFGACDVYSSRQHVAVW